MHPHQLFELLAATTWRTINRASGRRILFGEDAITSVNLLVLADGQNGTYAVEDTRVSESSKGCDFELWVGSTATKWRRYAIQAKKIQVSTGSYAQLKHTTGGKLQIDVLENYARANRARPLYCLYSFSATSGAWNCGLPNEQPQLGCSVTPSSVIRRAIATRGTKSFEAIHNQDSTLPWRCLVRCGTSSAAGCPRSTALSDSEWPNEYDRLPGQLEHFIRTGDKAPLVDPGGMYSAESSLRPQWTAVAVVEPER